VENSKKLLAPVRLTADALCQTYTARVYKFAQLVSKSSANAEDLAQDALERAITTDRYQQAPGQVDRLWILNVEGRRLVIDANYMPGGTAQDHADLARVVDSIAFLP